MNDTNITNSRDCVVTLRQVIGRVDVELTNSSGTEVGTVANPLTVTAVGSGGGTPTADVNVHDGAGNSIGSTTGALNVHNANNITGYATETTLGSVKTAVESTDTKLSDGTQKAQRVDGSGNVAPAGDTVGRAGYVIPCETTPTDSAKKNPSISLAWSSGQLATIAKTISGTTYTRTLTWTSGNLTAITAWS